MSLPLDQLRAQRELVKRHLDWLDAQIAEGGGSASAAAPALAPAPGLVPVETGGTPATQTTGDIAGAAALPAEVLLEFHAPEESGIPQGAKYGCVAIAVAIVLAFLFVLFVLPRFLYGDKKDKAPADDTTSAPAAGEYQPAAPPAPGVR